MKHPTKPAAEAVLSPAKESDYRDRLARKRRERGIPEGDIPAIVEDLLHRRLLVDFRGAGLFD